MHLRSPKARSSRIDVSVTSKPTLRKRSRLSDLPEELLLGILDQVGSGLDEEYIPGTIQTLHALFATSRQLHRLTESHLHSTIIASYCHCAKVLGRLENEPTLTRHIKQLVWDKKAWLFPELDCMLSGRIRAQEFAQDINIPFLRFYGDIDSWVDTNSALILFMLLTPRLEALEIMDPKLSFRNRFQEPDECFWYLLDTTSLYFSSRIAQRFANIRTIRFTDQNIEPEALLAVLRLPVLRTLSFKGKMRVKYNYISVPPTAAHIARLAAMPPRSSPIEYLAIENSSIPSKHVAMILHCIKALKELRLVFVEARYTDMRTHSGDNIPALLFPILAGAIMENSASLESLTIHNMSLEPQIYLTAAAGCLRLRQVRNLQYLSTNVVTLYRDETTDNRRHSEVFNPLPRGIRRLDLDVYEPVWPYYRCPKPALLSLATDCARRYPLLKEIRTVRNNSDEQRSWKAFLRAFREIELAFQSQEVAVKFYHGHGMGMST